MKIKRECFETGINYQIRVLETILIENQYKILTCDEIRNLINESISDTRFLINEKQIGRLLCLLHKVTKFENTGRTCKRYIFVRSKHGNTKT